MYKVENHKWTNLSPGNLYLSVYYRSTSPAFSIDKNIFLPDLSYTVSQYFMTLALMTVRQEVNNFESSVVVHCEPEQKKTTRQCPFASSLLSRGI